MTVWFAGQEILVWHCPEGKGVIEKLEGNKYLPLSLRNPSRILLPLRFTLAAEIIPNWVKYMKNGF